MIIKSMFKKPDRSFELRSIIIMPPYNQMLRRMNKKSEDTLTKEIIRLLTEWWLTTTEILVQNVGSEKALRSLKPYWDNGGRASAFNLNR